MASHTSKFRISRAIHSCSTICLTRSVVVFDFNGTVTATFAGVTHSQTIDSGMIPIPAGLTIGSNSIQFDIDGQHESLSYNAANVIFLRVAHSEMRENLPRTSPSSTQQCHSLTRPLTTHAGPSLRQPFRHFKWNDHFRVGLWNFDLQLKKKRVPDAASGRV